MSVTLCMPPRAGEVCVQIQFVINRDTTVMELTARHRVNGVVWDEEAQSVAVLIEITNPETSRPIDVRIDVVPEDNPVTGPRTRLLGHVQRNGETLSVYGTYLGVVADEN